MREKTKCARGFSTPRFFSKMKKICPYNAAKNSVTGLNFLTLGIIVQNLTPPLTQSKSLSPKGSCPTSCAGEAWAHVLRPCLRQHFLFPPHLQHSPYLMEFTLHYQHLRRRAVQLQAGGVEGGAIVIFPRWGVTKPSHAGWRVTKWG